jgi:leucyl/phenylalanyl-tRNA--protein transferase
MFPVDVYKQFNLKKIAPEDSVEGHYIGLSLDVPTDLLPIAYQRGIFPWPIGDEYMIPWTCPDPRGVILTENFKVPTRLKRHLKSNQYTIYFNRHFSQVINLCAQIHQHKNKSTWISEQMKRAYQELFQREQAFCVEVEDEKGELIGGLYGVCIGEIIAGESMFFLKSEGSKIALLALLIVLKQKNIPQLDTQMITSIVASFGGIEIRRKEFLNSLENLKPKRERFDIFPSLITSNELLNKIL